MEQIIKDIILQKIMFVKNINNSKLSDLNNEEQNSLCSRYFNLSPIEMVYLFYEIEKEFNICFAEKDIIDGKFKNISDIVNLIYCKKTL